MPRLDAIGIVVSSMADAMEFYRHVGLVFPPGSAVEGHVEVDTLAGVRVMFDTEDMLRSFSDWSPPQGGGQRNILSFRCESPAEVDRVYHSLLANRGNGVTPPFDAPWSMRYATVADPDDNHFDLFAPQENRPE